MEATQPIAAPQSRGLIRIESNAQIDTREKLERAKLAAEIEQNKPEILSLASHILKCWQSAKLGKIEIEQILLECMRQRKGDYDPQDLVKIRKHGGSEIYMMLTSMSCRTAEGWLKDVMIPPGDKPWALEPTPIPDLPDEIEDEITKRVMQETQDRMAMEGVNVVSLDNVRDRLEEVRAEVQRRQLEIAKRGVHRFEMKIEDDLREGNYYEALGEFITDLVTYPAAFFKGPVIRNRKSFTWNKDETGQPIPEVKANRRREYSCVSPFDMYFSPGAKSVNDGYLFERMKMRRSDLQLLKGVPGYKTDAINAVLTEYGAGGMRDWLWTDQERARGESTPQEMIDPEPIIDALLFWDQIQGSKLREWGMDPKKVPNLVDDYQVSVMLIGRWVVMARLNPHPLGHRPYYSACYENQNNSIWGRSVPQLMRPTQRMCNATARALANNMAIGSGPQAEVHMDRLAPGEDAEDMYPWKIWKTKSDERGQDKAAVYFFQPSDNSAALLKVYDFFFQQGSEVTGIPRYMYGSQKIGGAGKTASGLSMLMNAASKTLKGVVFHADTGVIRPSIKEHWIHIMLYDKDIEKTGDINVIARASDYLIQQEQLQMRRGEFAQNTNNPTDLQIMGLPGRATILRENAKSLKLPDDVIPSKQEMEVMEQAIRAQEQLMIEGPPGPGGKPAPQNPDGSRKGAEGAKVV